MKNKSNVPSHTSKSKIGMGDYYGTAIRNPVGTPREVFGQNFKSSARTKKPPKKLA